jgi:hypothetical protein
MASTTSKYNRTLFARRKTSDIQRLATQYQKQATGLTGEYETAFAGYQKQSSEQLAPFEQAMRQYQEVENPAYESAKSAYEQRLKQFNESLSNFQPKTKVSAPFKLGGDLFKGTVEQIWNIDGGKISSNKLPSGYSIEVAPKGTKDRFYDLYKDNPVPTFSEKAPSAPTAPTAPKIEAFNEEPFTRRREELQTTYQRELAERKSARLGAARRGSTRPMLQGE